MRKMPPIKIIDALSQKREDSLFWRSKTPEERLEAVEFLREQCYLAMGYKETPRLVRVISIVERPDNEPAS